MKASWLQELNKKFRTWKDLHSVTSASRWLESAFIDTAMVNCPTPSNSMAPLPAYPVEESARSLKTEKPANLIVHLQLQTIQIQRIASILKTKLILMDSFNGWDWQIWRPRPHWTTTEMVLKRFGNNIIFSNTNRMQDPWSREGNSPYTSQGCYEDDPA
ncbi:unnamed protein product [Arabidopsis lyrata]|nr:unnamed protein product [Arabidopsis lyrata]